MNIIAEKCYQAVCHGNSLPHLMGKRCLARLVVCFSGNYWAVQVDDLKLMESIGWHRIPSNDLTLYPLPYKDELFSSSGE